MHPKMMMMMMVNKSHAYMCKGLASFSLVGRMDRGTALTKTKTTINLYVSSWVYPTRKRSYTDGDLGGKAGTQKKGKRDPPKRNIPLHKWSATLFSPRLLRIHIWSILLHMKKNRREKTNQYKTDSLPHSRTKVKS